MSRKNNNSIIFFNKSIFKVKELIFDKPNKIFHLRELSKSTNISTTAVARAIDKLHEHNIITVEKTPITSNIKANLESEAYLFYKKIFNLYRLERSGLIKTIKEAYRAKTIVLFGSFAKGEDTENSDIDILILSSSIHKPSLIKFLNTAEKSLNRTISLTVLRSIEKSSSEFKNTISNGIVLHGYLKVI